MDPRGRILGIIPFRIPATSNSPTLNPGDFVLVSTYAYSDEKPRTGDMIVYLSDLDETPYVKRLIGLPEDRITIRDGIAHRNGKALKESYVLEENRIRDYSVNMDERVVPDEKLFFLGDNRDNSNDSRFTGFVPMNRIIGKVVYIFGN